MRREVTPTPITRVVGAVHAFTDKLTGGQLATDGAAYSAVVTFGSLAASVFNKVVDPGVDIALKLIEVGLTQRFTEIGGGTTNASLSYYWRARTNNQGTQGAWATLSPVFAKSIASAANSEDTVSGYIAVATIPSAPFEVDLQAIGLWAAGFTGQLKSSSYVRVVGNVLPGT